VSSPGPRPVRCPACLRPNPPYRKLCSACGTVLPVLHGPTVPARGGWGEPAATSSGLHETPSDYEPIPSAEPVEEGRAVPPAHPSNPQRPEVGLSSISTPRSEASPAEREVPVGRSPFPEFSTRYSSAPGAVRRDGSEGPEPWESGRDEGSDAGRGRRRITLAVVAIVVVVVVVLSVLLWPAPGRPVMYGTPLLESQAIGPGEIAQASMAGGPWDLVALVGLGVGTSPSGLGHFLAGCSTVWANSSGFVVVATPSNASAGEFAFWLMVATNVSGVALLTGISDTNGTVVATNDLVVEGTCIDQFDAYGAISGSVVDSSVVATAANASGASFFLTNYSVSAQVVALLGPYWEVLYTTCSVFSPKGTGYSLEVLYYASNGNFLQNNGIRPISCSTV
jgi:hypothetical protein